MSGSSTCGFTLDDSETLRILKRMGFMGCRPRSNQKNVNLRIEFYIILLQKPHNIITFMP